MLADAGLRRFFGKYRGHVVDNADPEKLGRIKALVPSVDGMASNWAYPCTPYAGPGVGMLMLPPVGALVWMEFEAGDPTYPIWTGCFWGSAADLPLVYAINSEDPAKVKVIKTDAATVMFDDTADKGKVMIKIEKTAVSQYPVTLTFSSDGAKLETGVCTMTMVPADGVTTKVSEATIEQTPSAITAKAKTITHQASPTKLELTGQSTTLSSPKCDVTLQGPLSVTAPQTSVKGMVEVTGASTFVGAVSIEGATDITGAVEVTGATALNGGVAIVGGGTINGGPIL